MCLGLIKFFRKIYWSEDSLFALKNPYVSENENTFIKIQQFHKNIFQFISTIITKE